MDGEAGQFGMRRQEHPYTPALMIELECDALRRCDNGILNFGADVGAEFATESGDGECVYGHSASIPRMARNGDADDEDWYKMIENDLNPLLHGGQAYPLMVVISGPSGVGKDALLLRLRELDEPFHFVVTATSRPARPNEQHGVDYFFYDKAGFENLIDQHELVEWAEVYGHYKGIPKQSIRAGLDSQRNVIMRIDVQGAATLKGLIPGAVQVFLAPGSMDELKVRLAGRGTETPEQFARRIHHAEREMAQVTAFDYVVFNHEERLDDAVQQIRAIIMAEQQRVRPRHVTV